MEARARAGRASAVLIVGPPGAGKSALLGSLARSSAGTSVLVSGGDRRLTDAPGGVAGLLTLPLLRRPIPRAVRGRLDRLWEDPECPPEAAAGAILACAAAAGRAPLVHLVDDVDELDERDQAVVAALVRLAATEPVVVVATARDRLAGWPAASVRLPPLSDEVVRQLLIDEGVHPRVAGELVPLVEGNPSMVHTLLATLTPEELAGIDRVPASLPPDPRLVAAAGIALASLDEDGRRSALDGALDDPLLATTLLATPPGIRRQAHAAAAHRTGGTQALLHRAAAAGGPDDALAGELIEAAGHLLDESDLVDAVGLLVSAGSVAASPALAGASWHRAAVGSYLTGQSRLALDLLGALRALPGAEVGTFSLDRLDALAGLHVDGVDAAIDRLVPAAERAARAGDHVSARSLLLIAGVYSLYGCRVDDLAEFAARAAALPADDPLAAATVALFSASADLYARADPTAVRELAPLLAGLADVPVPVDPLPDLDLDPSRSQFFAALLLLTDECWPPARQLLATVWRHDREAGWTGAQGLDVSWYAQLLWRVGEWPEALEAARRTLDDLGPSLGRSRLWLDAFLAGAELLVGNAEAAVRHRAAVTADVASPVRIPLVEVLMRSGTAVGLLGANDPAGALEHLEAVAQLAGRAHPGLVWWRADLVEALVATDQRAAAREAAAELQELVDGTAGPVLRGRTLRARGLALGGRRSLRLLAQAVDLHGAGDCPFELARSLLALAEARWAVGEDDSLVAPPAGRAQAIFERLGASGFAGRAAALGAGIAEVASLAGLSARERQVAELVASGATNDQVATELGVTASTVSFHLESIFRKLRVSSRTQLTTILSRS